MRSFLNVGAFPHILRAKLNHNSLARLLLLLFMPTVGHKLSRRILLRLRTVLPCSMRYPMSNLSLHHLIAMRQLQQRERIVGVREDVEGQTRRDPRYYELVQECRV